MVKHLQQLVNNNNNTNKNRYNMKSRDTIMNQNYWTVNDIWFLYTFCNIFEVVRI